MEGLEEGYMRSGIWYSSLEDELNHKQNCLEFAEDQARAFQIIGSILKPSILYLGIRAFGQIIGVGPEIDAYEPATLDFIAANTAFWGGICKFAEVMTRITDLREAKQGVEQLQQKMATRQT